MLLIVAYVILAHTGATGFWFFLVTVCWFASFVLKMFMFGCLVSDMHKETQERGKITTSLFEVRELLRRRLGAL